jgi:hypothetical protein
MPPPMPLFIGAWHSLKRGQCFFGQAGSPTSAVDVEVRLTFFSKSSASCSRTMPAASYLGGGGMADEW